MSGLIFCISILIWAGACAPSIIDIIPLSSAILQTSLIGKIRAVGLVIWLINIIFVFFVNNLGDITALDVNNGSLIWQTPTQNNLIYQDTFTLENSDIVFENDTIYFSNNKNEFFALEARTGIIKWVQSINSSLRPTIIEGLIFTVSNEGYLFLIDESRK